ncbi:hypothetical protein POVWA2_044510 [Plasmodium ovale wallikeri]|uniref:Uncharacterized protein n=1 Tax=Plasmodium ovale wallikeri TaxID=864142 RepID=A0A1A8ZF16_PLAOA|nr:hypothetical protein POVWA1_045940 [Plasmodium ovale wallikeri]SBT42739.1 hypothetical protein POVWA2_044510 [Plasmodium ovale wallikeri]
MYSHALTKLGMHVGDGPIGEIVRTVETFLYIFSTLKGKDIPPYLQNSVETPHQLDNEKGHREHENVSYHF